MDLLVPHLDLEVLQEAVVVLLRNLSLIHPLMLDLLCLQGTTHLTLITRKVVLQGIQDTLRKGLLALIQTLQQVSFHFFENIYLTG